MKDDLSNVIPIGGVAGQNPAKKELVQDPLASKETPPEMWVQIFLRLNNITFDYKTTSLRQNGEPLEYKTLISMMRLHANKNKVEKLSYYFKDAITVWMRDQSKNFLRRLRETLKHQPVEANIAEDWTRAVIGEVRSVDVAVLRHWIWQVKRKIFGLPVEHHLMPVLYGKSGGGKSVAVHKLLTPVMEVTLLQNMTVFNDQFARRMFARNFVIFFDEMGKSKQVDIDCMKNLITAPTVEWRGIQSESINSGKQNCTFIAASNDPLKEKIKDPTSARRFWQFDCSDELDWSAINNMDYLELWRSIDENGPCPLLPALSRLREIQERELRFNDPVEEWLSFSCETSPISEISPTTSELYREFHKWCEGQSRKPFLTLQKFSRILREKCEFPPKHVSKGTVWPLMVTPTI